MFKVFSIFIAGILISACSTIYTQKSNPQILETAKKPTTHLYHSEEFFDKYGWLRSQGYPEKDNQAVSDYLKKEQHKSDQYFKKHPNLTNTVFEEIISRIPSKNKPLSYQDKSFIYSEEYVDEADYKTIYITDKLTNKKSLLIDKKARAAGNDNYTLTYYTVSPNGRYVAFTEDTSGNGSATLYIKDIQSGGMVTKEVKDIGWEVVWSLDSASLYYVLLDDIGRDYQLHQLSIVNSGDVEDKIIYTEADENLFLFISLSKSEKYLIVNSWSRRLSEVKVLPMTSKSHELKTIVSKELDSQHSLEHHNENFYLLTNLFDPNNDIFFFNEAQLSQDKWQRLYEKKQGSNLKSWSFIGDSVAIQERFKGNDKLRIYDFKDGSNHFVKFEEDVYGISFSNFKQSRALNSVRFNYQSMMSPKKIMDYNVLTRGLRVIDQVTVTSFDKKNYTTETLFAKSTDGTKIPVSIMYNHKFGPNLDNPLYLYVYGAYGEGIPPEFPTVALSAIDRGFTFAIAHVRGGDELGNEWHEQGKLLNRKNTFDDFIAVSKHLINIGYVKKGNISVSGESSGGTVIANAINSHPSLFCAVGMLVPFVDVLHTLMDSSLIYTIADWDEFGNPSASKEVFNYIKSYSPYENITAQNYPSIYATAGLNDPAVGYWEIAKWIAKINEFNKSAKPVLMSHRMGGHIDASKYGPYYEFANMLSFLLIENGVTQ